MARYSKADFAASRAHLLKLCTPGTEVQCTLRHVSRSGMMRHISVSVVKRGRHVPITVYVARVLNMSTNDGRAFWALKVAGCGMDMGASIVYHLSHILHGQDRGDGAKPESAGRPFKPRRGHYRSGYSLTHRWI